MKQDSNKPLGGPPKIWNDSEVMIPFGSPNFISLAWKAKKLGEMGTACSLWALCVLSLRSLCTPSAPRPLCNPCATLWESHCLTNVWPLCQGPFEIDLGYWSTGPRDTDPQDPGILIHKIKNEFGILIHSFFLSFCQGRLLALAGPGWPSLSLTFFISLSDFILRQSPRYIVTTEKISAVLTTKGRTGKSLLLVPPPELKIFWQDLWGKALVLVHPTEL